jgi:hypothetical protein
VREDVARRDGAVGRLALAPAGGKEVGRSTMGEKKWGQMKRGRGGGEGLGGARRVQCFAGRVRPG